MQHADAAVMNAASSTSSVACYEKKKEERQPAETGGDAEAIKSGLKRTSNVGGIVFSSLKWILSHSFLLVSVAAFCSVRRLLGGKEDRKNGGRRWVYWASAGWGSPRPKKKKFNNLQRAVLRFLSFYF